MNDAIPTTKWPTGVSGNPAGRKPGAELVRRLLEPHREELVAKAVSMALDGDATALRIVMDRLAPPLRADSPNVHIPDLVGAVTLTEKANAIIAAVGKSEIGPDAAATLLQALGSAGRIVETDDLARRVAALEKGPS